MATILIRLEPEKLDNPDLDLRYRIPDQLEKHTEGAIDGKASGYDYTDSDAMLILMPVKKLSKKLIEQVISFVETERVLKNDLRKAAIVATSERDDDRPSSFEVVYGAKLLGKRKLFS